MELIIEKYIQFLTTIWPAALLKWQSSDNSIDNWVSELVIKFNRIDWKIHEWYVMPLKLDEYINKCMDLLKQNQILKWWALSPNEYVKYLSMA